MSVIAELRAQRKQTSSFIAAKPLSVTLTPSTRTKTSTGYGSVVGTPRPTQTMRLIDQSTTLIGNNPGRLRSALGEERKITHQLLGEYDAFMEVGDFWVADGARYEVDELLPDNGYERRAKVVRYGSE